MRSDIADTQASAVRLLQEQRDSIEEVFDTSLSIMQEAIIANIDQARQSVVSVVAITDIATQGEAKVGGGSGIVVSKSGYIITNKHVVADPSAAYTIITHDAKTYPVTKVWFDPVLDLAILFIDDSSATFS